MGILRRVRRRRDRRSQPGAMAAATAQHPFAIPTAVAGQSSWRWSRAYRYKALSGESAGDVRACTNDTDRTATEQLALFQPGSGSVLILRCAACTLPERTTAQTGATEEEGSAEAQAAPCATCAANHARYSKAVAAVLSAPAPR